MGLNRLLYSNFWLKIVLKLLSLWTVWKTFQNCLWCIGKKKVYLIIHARLNSMRNDSRDEISWFVRSSWNWTLDERWNTVTVSELVCLELFTLIRNDNFWKIKRSSVFIKQPKKNKWTWIMFQFLVNLNFLVFEKNRLVLKMVWYSVLLLVTHFVIKQASRTRVVVGSVHHSVYSNKTRSLYKHYYCTNIV